METKKKSVLVLLSSYNGEQYIEQQILSIINQIGNYNLTLRIRDDGSVDKTCAIIEKIKLVYPDKIELIKGENIGYVKSFFKLLESGGGYDYYSLSDQDDVWLPNKIDAAITALEKENPDIPLLYASTSYLTRNDLKPYGITREYRRPLTLYNTSIQNICPGHTQVLNQKMLDILLKFFCPGDVDKIYVHDSWITNMATLYGKVVFENASFTYYRQHTANQLGYGTSIVGRILIGFKRIQKGDGIKFRRQIEYFIKINETELKKQKLYDELERFVRAQTLLERIKYLTHCKLYRQSELETLAFKIAVLQKKF